MSRIRSIRPQIWDSEDFMTLSPLGRLLFVWLISHADDDGRLKASPPHMARQADIPLDDVLAQLPLMVEREMIQMYKAGVSTYVWVRNLTKHNRIDKPQLSQLPEPPTGAPSTNGSHSTLTPVGDRSEIARDQSGTSRDLSDNDPRMVEPHAGGIGKARQGKVFNPPTPHRGEGSVENPQDDLGDVDQAQVELELRSATDAEMDQLQRLMGWWDPKVTLTGRTRPGELQRALAVVRLSMPEQDRMNELQRIWDERGGKDASGQPIESLAYFWRRLGELESAGIRAGLQLPSAVGTILERLSHRPPRPEVLH